MSDSRQVGQFVTLQREPAYLKVYRAIEQSIINDSLTDGASLPIEAELCKQFGVTRSTVREGLRLLEQAGLIVRGSHKKFYVKRPSSADVAAVASRSLALGGVTFQEVWDALACYYPQAARLATGRLKPDSIEALVQVRATLAAADDPDHDATVDGAVDFFQIIAKGLDNRVMLAILQSLNLMIGESLRRVIGKVPNARARILVAQQNIIESFQQQDSDRAEQWMSKHIADLKRGYVVGNVDINASIL